jgi:ceramide glucosyltransferase
MIWLIGILVVLILGAMVFYLACMLYTDQFFRKQGGSESIAQDTASQAVVPEVPVAILVPVKGLDAEAWQNWTSLCQQHYLSYHLCFGVTDAADPAVPTLQLLAATYPDRVRLFVGLPPRGINHKDSILSDLLEQTSSEIVIFADSDIRVSPDYIQQVTAPLQDPDIGLVTCAFLAHDPQFLVAALAALGRCCDFIPSLSLAQVVDGGLRLAIGMTMAMRRETLAQAGGLHLNRIGSDYNLGKRVAAAGYRVELCRQVLESDTGQETLHDLYQRELRWMRTIRFNRGPVYYGLVFCFGTIYSLPLLLLSQFQVWAIGITVGVWLVRYLQAGLAMVWLDAPHLRRWLWALPLRDLFSFAVWLVGCWGSQVHWRGRRLTIQADGIITEI